jgi:hypothetical protein
MDPDLECISAPNTTDTRTVSPHETGTPEKTPTLKWTEPTWAERLLLGCGARVAVLDVWASPDVLAAAKTVGIPYIASVVGEEPYDCVIGLLPRTKHAVSFCYGALRAWSSVNPGGHMALVLKDKGWAFLRRFLPPHPRILAMGDRNAYLWRKPITKGTGHQTRHAAKKKSGAPAPAH